MANEPNSQKEMLMLIEERQEGSQYQVTKNQSIREIAHLIRTEIRKASKNGIIPIDWKYSVRLHRFTGGQAIEINVEIPKEFLDLCYDKKTADGDWDVYNQMQATKKFLKEIHESFNFYQSFFPGDGCAVRYFGGIHIFTKAEV